tara:strand:+ start:59233 stop:59361 length:129 start_codon:yes stop_codon:yes gene_type:complete
MGISYEKRSIMGLLKIKGAFFSEEGSFRYGPLIRIIDPNDSW